MIRILNWHFGSEEQPAYYMERDYAPLHVRIYAGIPPDGDGLKIDIRDDGTSIFANRITSPTVTTVVRPEIQYSSQSGAFTVNETITGGTSGATANVVSDTLGRLVITNISATNFSVDETITGGTSGSTANVDSFVRESETYTVTARDAENVAFLGAGDNLDTIAEDYVNEDATIEEGSMVTCHKIESNGASDITVQLELESLDSDEELN
jgi:hypothetical protein